MAATTHAATRLAYDDEGAGTPVVLLHGLTFDRRTWRPIIERLDSSSARSIAIDLPAHGESDGAPAPFDELAAQLHELLGALAVDRPIVVGHSMSGGLAAFYATTYPTCGLVVIDNGPDIRPYAQLVQRLEPALRGPGFADAWRTFEDSLGFERIPEPTRSLVLETHEVNPGRRRRLSGDGAAHRPGRAPSLHRPTDPQARRALPRRFRPADHRPRARTVRMAAGRAARGVGGRRPLRPPRRSRPLRHPATPVRRPLHRYRVTRPVALSARLCAAPTATGPGVHQRRERRTDPSNHSAESKSEAAPISDRGESA